VVPKGHAEASSLLETSFLSITGSGRLVWGEGSPLKKALRKTVSSGAKHREVVGLDAAGLWGCC
jgi:hypothetical protein